MNTQTDDKVNQEILRAAREIFSRYGLKRSTMDDVAKAIGKGKSTLYYYYASKNDLFEAVVKDEIEKHVKSIRESINKVQTSRGKLRAMLAERLELKKQMQNLSCVVQENLFDNMEAMCTLKVHFEKTQLEFVKEIILGGIQLGEFKKLNTEEVTFFAYWIVSGFSSLSQPLYSVECLKETDKFCDKLVDFIIDGVKK